ncbi:unnamed protein product [Camellia sinensis]
MGTVISKTANGIGTLLGNAFVAPLKAVFGGSCESPQGCLFRNMGYNLFYRAYVHLQSGETVNGFGALLHKLGICQCIGRSLCRMCWAACETYWFALEDFTCFLCHKLKNVKRVNRQSRHRCWRRFRDVELGCSSSEENTSLGVDRSVIRRRKLIRKRKDRPGSTFYPLRQVPKNRYGSHNHHHHHHHHLRLKTREVSVHVKGRSQGAKYSRQLQMRKLSNIRREAVLFKKRRFSFSLESQQLHGHSFKLSSEETGSHHVGMKGTRWAVLVAGSNGYENYRHQADVCHAYQLLRKGGLKDENIIVFMYDDIAFNVQNPRPGIIINRPQGEDVYEGVPKDYTGHNANVHNLYAVILANKTALTGGSGKVLDSGPEDHIFIYYTDHGSPGVLAMPYDDYVYANDLIDVLKKKHESNTFKSMVFYLEACESGSMFEGLLPEGLNIYATTAANAVESSFVTYCPDDYPYVAPEYDTCLGDLYSVSWMEDSDKHDLRTETLEQQYEVVRRRTSNEYPENGSHVMQYGNLRLRKKSLYDYLGTNPANENYTYMRHDSSTSISKPVSQNDADLLHFWHKFRKAPKGSEKKLEAQKQLIDELNQRLHIDHIMMFIAKLLFESENGLLMLETVRPAGQPLVDDWNCLKTLVRTYEEHCGSLSRYGMTYMRAIANMCNAGVKMEQMAMASAQACMGTTLIHAAPSTMN